MPDESKVEAFYRIAQEYGLDEDEIIAFFRKTMSRTPKELRFLLSDQNFVCGFVTALEFMRRKNSDESANNRDLSMLHSLIESIVDLSKATPHVTLN